MIQFPKNQTKPNKVSGEPTRVSLDEQQLETLVAALHDTYKNIDEVHKRMDNLTKAVTGLVGLLKKKVLVNEDS